MCEIKIQNVFCGAYLLIFIQCSILVVQSVFLHYEQYQNEVNMRGIEYPVNLSDIDKFENQNPDISISVFVLNNISLKVTPIRVEETIKKHISDWDS